MLVCQYGVCSIVGKQQKLKLVSIFKRQFTFQINSVAVSLRNSIFDYTKRNFPQLYEQLN